MTAFRLWKSNSGEIARKRLKLVLVSDKLHCPSGLIETMCDDLVQVLSRYMELDISGMDIRLTRTESAATHEQVPALYASIPIRDTANKGIT